MRKSANVFATKTAATSEKWALITGASSGLGVEFAQLGARPKNTSKLHRLASRKAGAARHQQTVGRK
ncbi:hypothetical protein CFBP5877_27395 (plasmid) [Agrobacterium tumefaciens]|uniref:Uncharacterized protein n=1 Tax=Agrobacterium tumefaciens TaxID=358 RepID=A0AAE6BHJ5_AGRTU|nr:hypothetical protein CFBP5877_27395 [Agrobacterium tumefaciens]CUX71851.1 hypothetical protein AGR6A_pa10036 [Agrobacterium sp. NCPPB 925]